MSIQYLRIQTRRDTSINWNDANPVLLSGEVGYETDTGKTKTGDGSRVWTALDYDNAGIVDVDSDTGLLVENGVLKLTYDHSVELGDLDGKTVKQYADDGDAANSAETAAVAAQVATLNGDVNTPGSVTKSVADAVALEATARATGDQNVQSNLDTEASTRSAADSNLQDLINSEASTRAAADTVLSGRLDVLEADPTTATDLANEASVRAAADTVLSGRLDVLEADPTTATDLADAVAALEGADTVLSGRLDVLEADPTTATDLANAVAALEGADTVLSGRLDVLEADPTTATDLADAVAALEGADTVLSGRLDVLEADPTTGTALSEGLALKADLAGATFTGNVTAPNTSDANSSRVVTVDDIAEKANTADLGTAAGANIDEVGGVQSYDADTVVDADYATVQSGAAAGATAVQPADLATATVGEADRLKPLGSGALSSSPTATGLLVVNGSGQAFLSVGTSATTDWKQIQFI